MVDATQLLVSSEQGKVARGYYPQSQEQSVASGIVFLLPVA